MAQTVWVFAWPILAVQPSAVSCRLSSEFPSRRRKATPPGPILELYLIESAKNDSSATMRLLRSDFIAATRSASSPSGVDRKSTRLNSSHLVISYAVFCLKKKKKEQKKKLRRHQNSQS